MNERAQDYVHCFYHKNRLNFFAALFFTVVSTGFGLFFSWVLGELLNVMTAGSPARLWQIFALAMAVGLLMFLTDLLMYRFKSRFIHLALRQYKSLAFSRLSEKNISAFSRENTGRYLSVLTNDVGSIEENYLNRFFLLLYFILLFFGSMVMMFFLSWKLALAAVALSALPVAASLLMGPELTRREQAVSGENERFVSQVKDFLAGFSVIKSFKAEPQAARLFEQVNREAEDAKLRRRWWECLLSSLANCTGLIVQFGIFFIGAYLAIRGEIAAGTVLITVNLCNFILEPIRVVPQYWASRKAAMSLIEKLAAVTGENAGQAGRPIPPVLNDAIELSHVTFGYQPDRPVLRDLSLRFQAGKKYAIVGASGSGKSTLLNLLMGGYPGYEGSISIDGVQLNRVDPDSLYDLVSLIGQSVFLFDDTLRSNLTMFRDFPDEQVDLAVKRSGLSDLISQKGKDYPCGENGVNLSGGERQRVSIARCLLRGTPVLLLDEATAALDSQTAFSVTDSILHLSGLTRVVITHRLESALMEQYDEIIVLRGGQIQEQGSFARLMEQKGYFYSLYTLSA